MDFLDKFRRFYVVNDVTGCWIWQGNRLPSGYGQMHTIRPHKVYAHRYSYEQFVGDIPAGCFVCHRCDVPSCVNPEHLFVGTPKDNTQDMIAKGRKKVNPLRGTASPQARLTEENVLDIRTSRLRGETNISIATRLGVNHRTISAVALRKSWSHI